MEKVVVTLCGPCIGSAPPSARGSTAVLAHGGWGCGGFGHMSSDRWATVWWGVLSSPTQALSGVGQGHLPHCNAQLPGWPPRGPGWPPAPVRDLNHQRVGGLGLCSWWQSWDEDAALAFPPAHLDFLLVSSCCCPFFLATPCGLRDLHSLTRD